MSAMTTLASLRDSATIVLAQMPGQNLTPQAPGEFGQKFDRGLNFAMYLGIGVAIIGVIVAGAAMVLSRREGTSEEATGMALRIGIGATMIGGAGSLIAAFL